MVKRQPINPSMSIEDIASTLSEGNIGALTTVLSLVREVGPLAKPFLLRLSEMNIRGPQIWVGYKDHCGCDLSKFIDAISTNDPSFLATINAELETGYGKAIPKKYDGPGKYVGLENRP